MYDEARGPGSPRYRARQAGRCHGVTNDSSPYYEPGAAIADGYAADVWSGSVTSYPLAHVRTLVAPPCAPSELVEAEVVEMLAEFEADLTFEQQVADEIIRQGALDRAAALRQKAGAEYWADCEGLAA